MRQATASTSRSISGTLMRTDGDTESTIWPIQRHAQISCMSTRATNLPLMDGQSPVRRWKNGTRQVDCTSQSHQMDAYNVNATLMNSKATRFNHSGMMSNPFLLRLVSGS